LERYSARTIGFYKKVMKELNNKKEREKRRAKKAEKAQNEESGADGEVKKSQPKKPAVKAKANAGMEAIIHQ